MVNKDLKSVKAGMASVFYAPDGTLRAKKLEVRRVR